jgi:hypothetical protein
MKRLALVINLVCVLAAAQAGAAQCSLRVRAWIDGASELHIKGDTAWWYHDQAAAPGREGCPEVNEPTILGSDSWFPMWPNEKGDPACRNQDCKCNSSSFSNLCATLPGSQQDVELVVNSKREDGGDVKIAEQPREGNGYELVVGYDDPAGGAFWYDVTLRFECEKPCNVTQAPAIGLRVGGVLGVLLLGSGLFALRRRSTRGRSLAG